MADDKKKFDKLKNKPWGIISAISAMGIYAIVESIRSNLPSKIFKTFQDAYEGKGRADDDTSKEPTPETIIPKGNETSVQPGTESIAPDQASHNSLAFLYQLQNTSYKSLSETNFGTAVIDTDVAKLTPDQITDIQSHGKQIIAYVSAGEAEIGYRGYSQGWDKSPPDFLLSVNQRWEGNFSVKFWDSDWQKIVIDDVVGKAKAGYDGVMLDVVDVYNDPRVIEAYGNGPLTPRQEMMDFITRISDVAKEVNPDFKVMMNNGLDMVIVDPNNFDSAANIEFLKKIDGINAETTFYGETGRSHVSWSADNVKLLELAKNNGIPIYTIDYPKDEEIQRRFIEESINHGFTPFVGRPELDNIPQTNYLIPSQMPPELLAQSYSNVTDHTTIANHYESSHTINVSLDNADISYNHSTTGIIENVLENLRNVTGNSPVTTGEPFTDFSINTMFSIAPGAAQGGLMRAVPTLVRLNIEPELIGIATKVNKQIQKISKEHHKKSSDALNNIHHKTNISGRIKNSLGLGRTPGK